MISVDLVLSLLRAGLCFCSLVRRASDCVDVQFNDARSRFRYGWHGRMVTRCICLVLHCRCVTRLLSAIVFRTVPHFLSQYFAHFLYRHRHAADCHARGRHTVQRSDVASIHRHRRCRRWLVYSACGLPGSAGLPGRPGRHQLSHAHVKVHSRSPPYSLVAFSIRLNFRTTTFHRVCFTQFAQGWLCAHLYVDAARRGFGQRYFQSHARDVLFPLQQNLFQHHHRECDRECVKIPK
jgi:hypothetical protein